MKRKIEYEERFKTKDQKIFLKRYAKETVLSWNNGKKIFKGEEALWRVDDFVKVRWPNRKVIWTSLKPFSDEKIRQYKNKDGNFSLATDLKIQEEGHKRCSIP